MKQIDASNGARQWCITLSLVFDAIAAILICGPCREYFSRTGQPLWPSVLSTMVMIGFLTCVIHGIAIYDPDPFTEEDKKHRCRIFGYESYFGDYGCAIEYPNGEEVVIWTRKINKHPNRYTADDFYGC